MKTGVSRIRLLRMAPLLFVGVGLLLVYALSAGSSAWATPSQGTLPGSLPSPTPQPGVLDFDVYAYQDHAVTGERVWFTARVVNGAGATIPQPPGTLPGTLPGGGMTVLCTLSNATVGAISVTTGSAISMPSVALWTLGPLAPGQTAYMHMEDSVFDGAYPVICEGLLTYDAVTLRSRAVINAWRIFLPLVMQGF
jgi:hypothetical protein